MRNKNYMVTAIFSRIISPISSDGCLWVDTDVTRSHVADTSSEMTILSLCFIKKQLKILKVNFFFCGKIIHTGFLLYYAAFLIFTQREP